MAVIAVALRHMLAAGMEPDAVVTAVAEMEAALPGDEQAERRRAKDRERKRLRNSAESMETRAPLSPDKEKSPPATPPKEINPSPDSFGADGLEISDAVEAFNAAARDVGWQEVRKLSAARRRSLALRLGELGGLAGWIEVLARSRGSPFLRGENDKGWRLTFDWLLKPGNLNTVMEGNYDPRQPNRSRADQPRSGHATALDYLAEHAVGEDDGPERPADDPERYGDGGSPTSRGSGGGARLTVVADRTADEAGGVGRNRPSDCVVPDGERSAGGDHEAAHGRVSDGGVGYPGVGFAPGGR